MGRVDAPRVGVLPAGARDSIADVPDVTVGHATIADGALQTGVTVVRPHARDLYREPVPAAAVVINGFGKTTGLVQLNELGTLESPIALTNTFAVGTVATAMIRHAIAQNAEIGRAMRTLNPVVAECNDGFLNDLQAFAVEVRPYGQAFDAASVDFAQGAVGAGRGMSCFELKGGIGSSSRMAGEHPIGALVLANFGRLSQMTLCGVPLGRELAQATALPGRVAASDARARAPGDGSIIVVLATDAPLDHRQMRRLATRAAAGIARTGANFSHGSGDIALAFSTRTRAEAGATVADAALDPFFDAAAEAVEQAIVHALFAAETVRGFRDHVRHAITERLPGWRSRFAGDP